MKHYDIEKPLIVIHVPKAAGTSSRTLFKNWFRGNFHFHYYDESKRRMPNRLNLFELHRRDDPLCLYGHFNRHRKFGVEDYYPEVDQFVTILRDPFELVVSNYFYIKKAGRTSPNSSRPTKSNLSEFLEVAKPNMLNHFPREMNIGNYKEICEEYFIEIGVTEKLGASLSRIAAKLGFVYTDNVPELNVSERDEMVPAGLKDKFTELNQLEFAVYNFALGRY